jgi:chromosomal replication initiator protein
MSAPPVFPGGGVLKDDFRQHLSRSCPEQDLRRWFDPLDLEVSEPDQTFRVSFPHVFFATWFETSVKDLFERQIGQFLGPGYLVLYRTGNGSPGPERTPTFLEQTSTVTDFPFGNQFTFETFLANEKNHFPLALAQEVSRSREVRYNPFLVCGPSGSGKTHLLRAMANTVAKTQDGTSIFFGSIGDIQNLYASKANAPLAVRAAMQAHDWLFIDELTDIRRAADLQRELIVLFNAFHDAGKQMVFSSAERVTSCDYLDPTLRSRLEWGLLVHLKTPDLDVRIAFVEQANRDMRLLLSREQVLTLASRFDEFRRLEGVLLRIDAFRKHSGRELTEADFLRHIRLSEDRLAPELTPERVLTVTAEHFGLTVADLTGHSRRKEMVFARQTAMALCRSLLGMSYPALGKLFGGKDHSTVLYSIRKFQRLQDDNEETKQLFRQLSKNCRQGTPS